MNMSEEVERIIVLSQEQTEKTLEDFYRCVAKEAGYPETEDTLYDCTKILVSSDVQDAIICAYQKIYPEAPLETIIMRLAISGPKKCADLGPREVALQLGFANNKHKD